MINEESIEQVDRSYFSENFIKPLYDSFCFSKIPASAFSLLTGKEINSGLPTSCFLPPYERYDMVLLFFLDGFGWKFFKRFENHPFCRRFLEKGMVSKLTAQFPSTTAAEVTSIHTGLEVGQTGIYEWYYYEPKVGRIIAPLLFSYAGDKVTQSLVAQNIHPSELFPFETIYQKLHKEGITSYLFQHSTLCTSPYSQRMSQGAHLVSYFTLKQGLQSLGELIGSTRDQKTYALFYYADIDSKGHRKGVDSSELEQEILQTLDLLESNWDRFSSSGKKVALMLTSDHGMTAVNPRNTFYLNQEYPLFHSFLKTNAEGCFLNPVGSCRDFFLHIKEECLEEAFNVLTSLLKGRAEIWKVSDLVDLGLFGSSVSSRFLERVGNLVILPLEGEAVWWFEKGRFEQHFYGAHGGLSRDELEIPFLFNSL